LKRYEVVAIVKSDLTEEEINAIMERSSNIITERQGVIAKAEKWGKRRLAYEIKKQKDGFFFHRHAVKDPCV
jgi:small subunit ribosomal protein S6